MTFDSSRRPCDSGAFATSSYEMNLAQPLSAATLVSAAVRVVLPWSICPIVPTFTCGLLRSNFSLAMSAPRSSCVLREAVAFPLSHVWSRCPESNWRPRPYQGRALPTELHRPIWPDRQWKGQPSLEPAFSSPTEARVASEDWSGRRGSNPRPTAWKAVTLPLSYS